MTIETYLEDGELTYNTWTAAIREDVLLGERCPECGHVTAAPKAACARCGTQDLTVVELPTKGKVYAETTIFVGPAAFSNESPYTVVLVDVGDARILAHVKSEVSIGDQVIFQGTVEHDEAPGPLFSLVDN